MNENIDGVVNDALIAELQRQCPDVCKAIDATVSAGGSMEKIRRSVQRGLERSNGKPDAAFTAAAIIAYAEKKFSERDGRHERIQ